MNDDNEFIFEDKQSPTPQSKMVSPLRGFHWLERGIADVVAPYFKEWFIAGLVYSALVTLIQMVHPFLAMIATLLVPIFIAGGVIGAGAVFDKRSPSPAQFFSGFQASQIGQLVLFTVLHFVILLTIGWIILSIIGMDTIQGMDLNKLQDPNEQEYALAVMQQVSHVLPWMMLLSLAYLFLTWFTPSLIVHAERNAFSAISESFFASIKNLAPFVLLLVLLFIITLILSFIFGIVLTAIGGESSPMISLITTTLLQALVMPIYIGMIYVSYREVFLGDIKKSERSL